MPQEESLDICVRKELSPSPHSLRNKVGRVAWGVVWGLLFRPSPRMFHGWRRFLLRVFGAVVGRGVKVYPTARFWAPWNAVLNSYSCVGDRVDFYNIAKIHLGEFVVVSQDAVLCAATHDYRDVQFPLVSRPIHIADHVWIAAGAFVGPGSRIGKGAIVGARAVVMKDVEDAQIVAGNPARVIGVRAGSYITDVCDRCTTSD